MTASRGKYSPVGCINRSGMYKANDYINNVESIVRSIGIKVSSFAPAILREILHQEASANEEYKKEIGIRFLVKRVGCCRKTANRVITAFVKAGIVYVVRPANRHKHLERIIRVSADLPTFPTFKSEIARQRENAKRETQEPRILLHDATNLNHPSLSCTTSVEAPAEEREGAHDLNAEMPKDEELEAPAGAVDSAIQRTENDSLILDCGEHHEAQPESEPQTHQEAPGSPRHRPEVPRATPAPRNRQEYSREEKFRRESRQQSAKDRFYRRRCQGKPQDSAFLRHPAAKVEVRPRASEALFRLVDILAGLSVPLVAAGEVARRLSGKAEQSILDLCAGIERLAADGAEFDPVAFCRSVAEEYPRFLRWRQAMGEAWAAGWLRLKVLRGRLEACGVRCVDWALDQLSGWALVEFPNLEEILARFPDWTEGQTTLRNPGGFLAKLCSSPDRFREWLPRLEVILKPGLDPREVRKAEARALRVSEEEKLRQENEAARREPDGGREKYPLAYLAHYHGKELTKGNKAFFEETRESIKNSVRRTFPCYVGLG